MARRRGSSSRLASSVLPQSRERANAGSILRSLLYTVRRVWAWLLRRLDATYLVAVILIAGGAAIFFTAQNISWLQGAGGVIVGTGFTVLITTITSRRAVHEQYAKDANLRRKDNLYAPLYGEIKSLREMLQRAYDEGGAYPQRITTSYSVFNEVSLAPPGYPVPTLIKWSMFKQGYYWNDFTESARHVLDRIVDLAEAYNQTVSKVPDATIQVLSTEIEQAIQRTKSSDEYIAWQKNMESYPSERFRIAALRQGEAEAEETWFRRLDYTSAQGTTRGHAWASSWIMSWPIQHEPPTVGYLLAGNVSTATRVIHMGYLPGGDPSPPIQWIEDIFQRAMPKLEALASYQEAHVDCDRLYIAVREAEQMLLNALNDIQQRYEGGRPPL